MMMTATTAMRFNVDPTELIFASHLVGKLPIHAWMSVKSAVRNHT